MKEFWGRVGLFAPINAVLIGLCLLVTNLPKDMCVLYPTLASCFLGVLYEPFYAHKKGKRMDIAGGVGGAWFGPIVIGGIIFAIMLLAKVV